VIDRKADALFRRHRIFPPQRLDWRARTVFTDREEVLNLFQTVYWQIGKSAIPSKNRSYYSTARIVSSAAPLSFMRNIPGNA